MVSKPKFERTGSAVVEALEDAWRGLQAIHREIPDAVIVVLTGARASRLGHFARSRWRVVAARRTKIHEVAISPRLFPNGVKVLGTMVHEAAHAALWPESGGGVSPDGYYHKKEFRDQCILYGLECQFTHTRYGWSRTGWPRQEMPGAYLDVATKLSHSLLVSTEDPSPGGSLGPRNRLPESGLRRLSCHCSPPRSIYAGRSLAKTGGVQCGLCGWPFGDAEPR